MQWRTSNHLARLLKIDKSTLAEHLRKAERKIIASVLT
ncbi:MAG: helix-turn-helix domain-containing protein [Nitrososphaerales archaeon]